MASFTITFTDSAPGEVTLAFAADPPVPDRAADRTPAQRAALEQFGVALALLRKSPYPEGRVSGNGGPSRRVKDLPPDLPEASK